jgi:hypothetical protein
MTPPFGTRIRFLYDSELNFSGKRFRFYCCLFYQIPSVLGKPFCKQGDFQRASYNKIVQRFYQTPEGLSSGSNKRKDKIPIPAAPKTGFPLRFNTFLGYFGIFTTRSL